MKEIKVNELTDNLFETISKELDVGNRRYQRQIQHHDGKLGRCRISMEPSGSLYSLSAPSVIHSTL